MGDDGGRCRARGPIFAAIYTEQAGNRRFRFSAARAAARGLAMGWEFFAPGGTSRAEQSCGSGDREERGDPNRRREAPREGEMG
jgi:hypothetical protein